MLSAKTIRRLTEISIAALGNRPQDTRHRHICYILKHNKIKSIGFNSNKTHPRTKHLPYVNPYAGIHAELSAIIKYGHMSLEGYILVVMRVTKTNKLAMSRPCEGCQCLIKQLNPDKVYYSTEEGEFQELCMQ